MDKIDRLVQNEDYYRCMEIIGKAENKRKFCLHGMEHGLDVARISYIINLEEQLGYDKEVIYAMSLLHDIGRVREYESNVSHHQAGVDIAKNILLKSGFDSKVTDEICHAIASHNKMCGGCDKDLKYLLYRADKLSRNCFNCDAYDDCYWSDSIKNKTIII